MNHKSIVRVGITSAGVTIIQDVSASYILDAFKLFFLHTCLYALVVQKKNFSKNVHRLHRFNMERGQYIINRRIR